MASAGRQWLNRLLGVFCVLALLSVPGIEQLALRSGLEFSWQDWLVRQRAAEQRVNEQIVIIDIDDDSLNAMAPLVGKWPWPRSLHAELIEFLLPLEPQAIVFDLLFSEADHFRPDSDGYLSEVLAGTERVFLGALEQQPGLLKEGSRSVPPLLSSYPAAAGLQAGPHARLDERALLLLPRALPASVWRLGSVNFEPDADGVGRYYDLYRHWPHWRWPSLSTRVAQYLAAQGAGAGLPETERIRLDWQSAERMSYARLSFAALLSQARGEGQLLDPQWLRGKIFIIGTTASGLHDLRPTPIDELQPGSFILATALDNLLSGQSLIDAKPLLSSAYAGFLCVFIWLALLRWPLGSVCGLVLLVEVLALGFVYRAGVVDGVIYRLLPALLPPLLYLLAAAGIFYWHFRRRYGRTVAMFSRLLDPQLVKQLVERDDPEALLASRSCELTVLFSDIRNFTSLSETRTPGEVVSLLNNYFERQVATLFAHQGTVDKFIGDAVMAFWGAPLDCDHQALKSIHAALEMIDNLESFKREYGYRDFDIGIGLHTGDAVVGMIGTRQRYDYTAIGDSVNLASRIEGLTKQHGRLLVSESTKLAAEASDAKCFCFTLSGEFHVKGREQPVRVYGVVRA